jgi:hypothetical protein
VSTQPSNFVLLYINDHLPWFIYSSTNISSMWNCNILKFMKVSCTFLAQPPSPEVIITYEHFMFQCVPHMWRFDMGKLHIKWVAFLVYILDVLSSNLRPKTCYPAWGFSLFCPYKQILGYYLKLGHISFLSHPFQFIIHQTFHNVMLCSLASWQHCYINHKHGIWHRK